MTKEVKQQIENWQFIQNLSLDILRELTDEQLGLSVGKNMGALGEQFRHMIRVRFQYAEAIENRKLAEVIEKFDPAVAKSKVALMELWDKANSKLLAILGKLDDNVLAGLAINWNYWGVPEVSLEDHLNYLMDHETLHNGEIIVYLRIHSIPFPKSWEAWGL